MNPTTAHVRVLNSLLFIKDARVKELPAIDGIGAIWIAPSCVAVSCMPDCDGPTEVVVGGTVNLKAGVDSLLFEGRLETPSQRIVVQTVLGETVLERDVPRTETYVRVWTNGLRDTDRVVVGLG